MRVWVHVCVCVCACACVCVFCVRGWVRLAFARVGCGYAQVGMYEPDVYAVIATRVTYSGSMDNDNFADAALFPDMPIGHAMYSTRSNVDATLELEDDEGTLYPGRNLDWMVQRTLWYTVVVPAGATRMWVRRLCARVECAFGEGVSFRTHSCRASVPLPPQGNSFRALPGLPV